MRNTATFQKKAYPIAVRCLTSILYFFLFSLSSLAACVDKEPVDEEDTDPAINPHSSYLEEEESGGNTNSGPAFPVFVNYAPAFPDAVGYGRNAEGARASSNREVYVVTNLNDKGAGSFRDAISQPNRIIVFDVDGVIECSKDALALSNNLTILGNTAPGDGVVLVNSYVSASNRSNVIIRYLRIRMGNKYWGEGSKDCLALARCKNVIVDHCSITWGRDENCSVTRDSGESSENVTIQNCIIGQGLENHSCGGLMESDIDKGITCFRNLLIDNKTRNFKVKGLNQFVNNVLYNWGEGAAYNMSGNSEGDSEVAIEDNYFIVGPGNMWRNALVSTDPDGTKNYAFQYIQVNPAKPFKEGNSNFRAYLSGNYYDTNKNGVLDGHLLQQNEWSGTPTILSVPSELHPSIKSQTNATDAYKYIVEKVGAYLPTRDEVDTYLIEELTSLGTKGTIIGRPFSVEQFSIGGCGNFKTGTPKTDTDGDGMPDDFEDKWGLDKNKAQDAIQIAENGYTMIENYALSLEYPAEYEKAWKEAYSE
ncbi:MULTISPECIES: pectate lyase family protein [Bacteroides]|uniref:Pectate lyase n=1 Tax=Bacteroides ovatus TaxID=28116 RepID=A0A1G6G1A5_BACOV|nr:pectate lyase [Bacteroides ovatus]MDC2624756.1 pectate lyase [Bacteroides ovatus]MDC2638618.1 pectate lyase [Bacteroides ovatus]MDC2651195.1 pectate lyase [Bacteroides ovatus]SDB75767.1 hypothetical protein SAMN05192581_10049 [Bacteroides ovatus]